MAMRKCSLFSFPVAVLVLVLLTSRVSGDNSDDLCVGDNRTKINPNMTFQPVPESYDQCDYDFCFCVAYNNASCPWNLNNFPSDVEGLLSGQGFKYTVTFDEDDNMVGNTTMLRFCQKESTYLEYDKKHSTTRIAPTGTECGTFFYVQHRLSDNYYARESDIRECPTSWKDVPQPSSASASSLFLPIPLILLLALMT